MLQVEHLSLIHRRDLRHLVEDVSFVLNPGDKLAIIGEEGNGKSVLLKALMQDPSILDYIELEGTVVNSVDHFSYLPQSLEGEVLDQPLQAYFFQSLDPNEIDYGRLFQAASQLGFSVDRLYSDQTLASLSGGERVKVQLLRIAVQAPNLVFLDEPSNDLDLRTSIWLEKWIQDYQGILVYISHDVDLLKKTATAILHLEQLVHKTQTRTTFKAVSYDQYLKERALNFDRQAQLASQQQALDKARMKDLSQVTDKVHRALNNTRNDVEGRLLAKKMASLKAQAKRYERDRENFVDRPIQEDAIRLGFQGVEALPASKQVLYIDQLDLRIQDRLLAKGIHFELYGQDKIGIIGDNGVGKSTFLSYLWQRLLDKEGLRPGFMPQTYESVLSDSMTPIAYLQETGDQEELTQIMTYLGSMHYLPEEMQRPIHSLSGGQKAKLLVLKLDFQKANVLFLDEPTRNFSPTSQPELIETFQAYPGAMVVVSHERSFLRQVCQKIYELTDQGLRPVDLEDI